MTGDELLPVRAGSRTYQLQDVTFRSDGSGRIVDSYFAVFDKPAEVMDQDGHYVEVNARTMFAKTLTEKGLNIPVFYNHARTLDGTPSGELSVPVGVPLEIRTDEKGVWNSVRYLDNPLADSVLDGIRHKAIGGMSFSGRYIKSVKTYQNPYTQFTGRSGRKLPLITRHEYDLREFGPTAIPAFKEAEILSLRAQQVLGALLSAPSDKALAFLQQFEGLTTPDGEPEALTFDTPQARAVEQTEEPHLHSARSLASRIRAARLSRGME